MESMILGETLQVLAGETDPYIGYWMPAGGNNGVGAVETFYVSTASRFTVHIETKKSDENDDAPLTSIGEKTIDSTTPDVFSFPIDDAEDLVRYTVVPILDQSSDQSIHLQFSPPTWAPN